MTKRAIIFLDFDGVVHPVSTAPLPATWREVEREVGRQYFHTPAVRLLNCLCTRLDAEIVLISSWRFLGFPLSVYAGLFKHRLVDQTPECTDVPLLRAREREVLRYLDRFSSKPAFVVIDDQSHHYEVLAPQLVCPDSRVGLVETDVSAAFEVLTNSRPEAQFEKSSECR